MTTTHHNLKRKANDSLSELIEGLKESEFASRIFSEMFGQSAKSLGIDLLPVSNELDCYGAFCIAVNSTQYIRKNSFFGGNKPDEAGAKLCSDYLTAHLFGTGHSVESYSFYLNYNDPNESPKSHPFTEFEKPTPDIEIFQIRFVDYKFKVSAFASRLTKVILTTLPKTYKHKTNLHGLYALDLLPTGRQIAEITADITKKYFTA